MRSAPSQFAVALHSASTGNARFRLLLVGVMLCVFPGVTLSCNIPVFRYALERWTPDESEIIVFHDTELSSAHRSLLDLQSPAKTILIDVRDDELDPEYTALWKQIPSDLTKQVPLLTVRTKIGKGRWINHTCRPLSADAVKQTLTSPARTELQDRLLAGHAIVWLLVQSGNQEKDQAARDLVRGRFTALAKNVSLPEGIGLPGSELFAEVPLLLRFSLLEIDPKNEQESFLVDLLTRFHSEAFDNGEPLLVPVFGRGRALEVLPASRVSARLIDDLTHFLSAACSCQVKDQNPGFDLLMPTDWDLELFGVEGDRPPDRSALEGQNRPPVVLAVPPGRNRKPASSEGN
ncbi:MAG: hypothetical protein AAF989_08895 [Planctomycetota bacterium]